MTFGDKLLALRKEGKWSQQDVAKKISTTQAMIGKYERNEIKPSIEVAQKLAELYGVSLDYLANDKRDSDILKNKDIIERLAKLEEMPVQNRERILYLVDALIRDHSTQKAYSK